jgi:hypothetical protein
VKGEGRLTGSVPLVLRKGPPLRIDLGRGRLEAAAGAKLYVTDLATARELLAQAGLNQSMAEMVKQRLLEALTELELSKLDLQLVPRPGDVDLTVSLAGRGARGARQEIGGLTVNFKNFGTGLNQVLRFEAEAAKLKDRAKEEMKDDAILDLFQ